MQDKWKLKNHLKLIDIVAIIVATAMLYGFWTLVAFIVEPKEDKTGESMKGTVRYQIPSNTNQVDLKTEDAKEYYTRSRSQIQEALSSIQTGNLQYAMVLIKDALRDMERMREELWH